MLLIGLAETCVEDEECLPPNLRGERRGMKEKVLEEIKMFAIQKLRGEYEYCAVAEGDDFAMLNSSDKKNNEIKVTIKLTPNNPKGEK